MELPLTGWPTAVIDILWKVVHELAENTQVKYFKIGRTNNPQLRYQEYVQAYQDAPPTGILVIYKTDSIDHVMNVEANLIRSFSLHPKCLNRNFHAGGNISPYYVQYVYVVFWIS